MRTLSALQGYALLICMSKSKYVAVSKSPERIVCPPGRRLLLASKFLPFPGPDPVKLSSGMLQVIPDHSVPKISCQSISGNYVRQ